jgi:hypothetical protein
MRIPIIDHTMVLPREMGKPGKIIAIAIAIGIAIEIETIGHTELFDSDSDFDSE